MARTIPDLPRLDQPAALPTPKSSDSFWHTEPSPLLLGHRSTRSLPSTADVVIIGSGITGTSIARHLLKKEGGNEENSSSGTPDVVMLEAREACWGATGRVCWLYTCEYESSQRADKSYRTEATANHFSSSTPTIPKSGTSSSTTGTHSKARSKAETSTASG